MTSTPTCTECGIAVSRDCYDHSGRLLCSEHVACGCCSNHASREEREARAVAAAIIAARTDAFHLAAEMWRAGLRTPAALYACAEGLAAHDEHLSCAFWELAEADEARMEEEDEGMDSEMKGWLRHD